MYINNITGKPIKEISFSGYYFTIPAGVSVCWDKFGEFLFKDIYKISGEGGGTPPVVPATAAMWKGDRYVEVKRFPLNHELIPARRDLIKLAKQRGVDKATLELWDEEETIENKVIVDAINELAVPEEIQYPSAEAAKVDPEAAAAEKAAEDALKGPPAPVVPVVAPKPAPAVGKTVAAKKVAKKQAAKKTPSTPKGKPEQAK